MVLILRRRSRRSPIRACGRMPLAAVVAVVFFASACAASGATARNSEGADGQPPVDSYYHDGQKVRLERSQREYVVRFAIGAPEEAAQRLRTLLPAASIGEEINDGGRVFRLIKMGLEEDGMLDRQLNMLRREREVDMVAPVFYHYSSGARMVPTDEIVVKLKAGGTRQQLVETGAPLGLTVHDLMPGTGDEYVVRLNDGKRTDAVEKARVLYESGKFEWVEPSFIRELQRGAV